MLAKLFLLWVFWVNLQLSSSEDIERRKHPMPFRVLIAEASWLQLAMIPPFIVWLAYIIGCWINLLGACGEAELILYQWMLTPRYI